MRKGFTLIELLVIITIMGLLATLLIPNVVDIVERTEKKTFIEDGKGIIRASENYINQNIDTFSEGDCFDVTNSDLDITLSKDITSGDVCFINSKAFLKHISNGDKCMSGFDSNLEVYDCNNKVIVFFDGTILGRNNTPYVNVPFKAMIVDKNKMIDLSLYYRTYTEYNEDTKHNAYNFWEDYNLQHVATKWINQDGNEVSNLQQSVIRDTIYRVSEIVKTNDSKPTYYGLRSGDYEISIASDDSLKLGYLHLGDYDNVPLLAKYGIWTVKNYGDYYKLFSYDNTGIVLDSTTGYQEEDAMLDAYPNYTDDNAGHQQRFKLIKTSENDVYLIQGYVNEDVCVTAGDLTYDSNMFFGLCDSSNPNQLFRFKQYK